MYHIYLQPPTTQVDPRTTLDHASSYLHPDLSTPSHSHTQIYLHPVTPTPRSIYTQSPTPAPNPSPHNPAIITPNLTKRGTGGHGAKTQGVARSVDGGRKSGKGRKWWWWWWWWWRSQRWWQRWLMINNGDDDDGDDDGTYIYTSRMYVCMYVCMYIVKIYKLSKVK